MRAAITIIDSDVVVHLDKVQAMMSTMLIGAFSIMAFTIWAIVILYLGYKHVSRLQGARVIASFIIGLIVAELISKLLIVSLF